MRKADVRHHYAVVHHEARCYIRLQLLLEMT